VAAAVDAQKTLGALVGGGLGIAFCGGAGYVRAYVYGGKNALADHFFLGRRRRGDAGVARRVGAGDGGGLSRRVGGVRV
jgi:hypothetical protein